MTRRRWIADRWDDTTATLQGEQASHLVRVLRARAGMEFDIVTGDRVWRAAIAAIDRDQVLFHLLAEVEAERALPVTLLLSIFKFDRMEWLIEKGTELGVERIVPMIARRTEKHLAQTAQARVERWRRIAREAAKQSRRSDIASIGEVQLLKDALKDAACSTPEEVCRRLLLAEQERATSLRTAMQQVHAPSTDPKLPKTRVQLAVGPEGGWTEEEEAVFATEGWMPVSLGPRILRAETAGIAAIAIVAALLP